MRKPWHKELERERKRSVDRSLVEGGVKIDYTFGRGAGYIASLHLLVQTQYHSTD